MNLLPARRHSPRILLGVVAATLLVLTSGCGASSPGGKADSTPSGTVTPTDQATSSSPTPSDSVSPTNALGLPECATVWVTGQVLPEDYQGCTENGQFVEPDIMYCESGQSLATYQNRYYAALGQVINEAPNVHKTKIWRKMQRTCTG